MHTHTHTYKLYLNTLSEPQYTITPIFHSLYISAFTLTHTRLYKFHLITLPSSAHYIYLFSPPSSSPAALVFTSARPVTLVDADASVVAAEEGTHVCHGLQHSPRPGRLLARLKPVFEVLCSGGRALVWCQYDEGKSLIH